MAPPPPSSSASSQFLSPHIISSAEAVVSLIDSYWFEQGFFSSDSRPFCTPQSESLSASIEHEHDEKILEFTTPVACHTRSLSDHLSSLEFTTPVATVYQNTPNSVFDTPKLETIPSGGEIKLLSEVAAVKTLARNRTRSRRGRRARRMNGSRSLTELEFEELKGFMDLGFVFPEKNGDLNLASLIPALQRRGGNCNGEGDFCDGGGGDGEILRPYLSEAWEFLDREEETKNLLSNWKMPFPGDESDMKHSLKFWAHTVASAVR